MRDYVFKIKSSVVVKFAFWISLLISIGSACSNWAGEVEGDGELELARSAAKAFCTEFGFPADKISELDDPPLFEPVSLEREGRDVTAYRWLGGGRGTYYVQVEVYQDNGQVIVYGSFSDQEFGPWDFDGTS